MNSEAIHLLIFQSLRVSCIVPRSVMSSALAACEPFPRLFSPITIAGKAFPNRFIMSPISLNVEAEWRKESLPYWEALAEFHAARVRGGCSLVVVGGVGTSVLGRQYARGFSLSTYQAAEGMRKVTEAIKEAGGTPLLQLSHYGRSARSPITLAPSRVPNPTAHFKNWPPIGIPGLMLGLVRAEFHRCAALAHHAGFEGVEIQAGNGTLLHNFLCRATNKRDDAYGGPIEQRIRLLMEVLSAVRDAVPPTAPFIVACKLSVHDAHPEGNDRDDILYTHEHVAASRQVDLITTTVGSDDSPAPILPSLVPRGAFAECVGEVRAHLRAKGLEVPIAASHRINNPTVAEQLLANGVCDMVCLGRALLADSQFVANAKVNSHLKSVPCIGCGHCLDMYWKAQRVTCAINPVSGFELEKALHPVKHPRSIAVVGAGPAGITCALTLARRGHQVILYERNDEIGGQLNLAKVVPGKEEYFSLLQHWVDELKNSTVHVKLNSKFCREDVAGGHQLLHAVVFTTGSVPKPISSHNMITAENVRVVPFEDVLTRKVVPGGRVGILGQGAIAYDVASYLLHDPRVSRDRVLWSKEFGINLKTLTLDMDRQLDPKRNHREVTMFQRADHPPSIQKSKGWILKRWLKAHQMTVVGSALLGKVDNLGLHISVLDNGRLASFDDYIFQCDTLVWCWGMMPSQHDATWIHEWIKDGAVERGQATSDFAVYLAGSCRNVYEMAGQGEQDLFRVIQEAYEIGCKI